MRTDRSIARVFSESQIGRTDAILASGQRRQNEGKLEGKTPMQTFIDMLPVANEKLLQAA